MKTTVFSTEPLKQKGDTLVIGLFEGKDRGSVAEALDQKISGQLAALTKAGDLRDGLGKVSVFHPVEGPFRRVFCVGLGKQDKYDLAAARKALQAVAGTVASSRARVAVIALPALEGAADAMLECTILAFSAATYRFNQFKTRNTETPELKEIRIHSAAAESADALVKQAEAIADGVRYARDLANMPGNHCTPTYLGKEAKKLAKAHENLSAEVLGEKEMSELGMHSLLSVGKGSAEESRLIILVLNGERAGKTEKKSERQPHVLVGKGITFDTGGISLKPGPGMDEMKFDMGGAAAVLGTMKALAEMGTDKYVIGIVASAENMPDGKASKPGDIVTSLSGQTIEILNTDAEGRLVLCDALTYAARYNPASIVDTATLTGAIIIALGHHASGLMSRDDELARELLEAGEQSGDRCWRLPLWDDYDSQLDSPFADMQNIGSRSAGSITAGCFLGRFTRDMKWAHLDVAGTASLSGKDKGATGRPVPLLTRYILNKPS